MGCMGLNLIIHGYRLLSDHLSEAQPMTVIFFYCYDKYCCDCFLNNQPDALIIQIYSVIKFHMFPASSLPIIRSFPLYVRQW